MGEVQCALEIGHSGNHRTEQFNDKWYEWRPSTKEERDYLDVLDKLDRTSNGFFLHAQYSCYRDATGKVVREPLCNLQLDKL